MDTRAKLREAHSDASFRPLFSKRADRGNFECEGEGLRRLRKAAISSVPQYVHVPAVFLDRDNFGIDVEDIPSLQTGGDGSASSIEKLARGLRVIHEYGLPDLSPNGKYVFGFSKPGQCGQLEHPNNLGEEPMAWVDFFKRFRLEHQLSVLKARHPEQVLIAELLTKLIENLDVFFVGRGLLPKDQRPSLLHGDLWNGNWGTDPNDNVWIFDPAPFYGHFEFDFGIGYLFGGPISKTFLDAYFDCEGGSCIRTPGIEDRIQLYALYHSLNHLNMFGKQYIENSLKLLEALTSKAKISS